VVADAYISMWDSTFRDRLFSRSKPLSKIVRWIEGRALRCAHRVIVDTEANKRWMIDAFRLDPSRVVALPLAIDSRPFHGIHRSASIKASLRVLFIGTLIPLHGLDVIAKAARLLGPESRIAFHFLGDGQEAEILRKLEREADRAEFHWTREWASPEDLSVALAAADVCLGVFGGEGKASRVLPFKLYMAMAAGRPVVTQNLYSLPSDLPAPPWLDVAPRADELAAALLRLRDSPELRNLMGEELKEYFNDRLSSKSLAQRWAQHIV